MSSAPLNEIIERTRLLISTASENVYKAKLLCELADQLRYDNRDFRDFLREMRVSAMSMSERRRAERTALEYLPAGRKVLP
jgi:Trm5-related predicted tRNA methylase